MQRILKITLQGFKSFARKTTIPLEKNFICIAGANGSGKSNICDAFLFIFGKSSSRLMRAQKLEDLIFKGSDKRKGEDEAIVEIEINNKDKILPYEEERVRVERRISKEGVSSYRINGKIVPKHKVVELFRALNISPEMHNVISQGEVTRILEMDSIERRKIIDDLAGIAEFDEKKKKAEKELEKVEETLKEQKIILEQKEKMFADITVEKKKVEAYNDLSKKIAYLKYSILVKKLEDAKEKEKNLKERLDRLSKKREEVEKEMETIDFKLEELEKELKDLVSKVFTLSREMPLLEKKESIRSKLIEKRNAVEFNLREIERLKEMVERIKASNLSIVARKILNAGIEGVYGTVSEIIKAKEGYELAIEAALLGRSNDIVVKDMETAIKCIEYLKENRIGRGRFLPIEEISELNLKEIKKDESVLGLGIEFAKYDKKFEKVANWLLGNTLVIKDIKDAKKYREFFRVVSLDGSLFEKSGALFGGYYKKPAINLIGEYEKEIEKFEKENERLKKEIEELEKVYEEILAEEEREKGKYRIFEEEKEKIENEINELRKKRRILLEKKLKFQEEENSIKIKLAKVEVEIENLKKEEIEKFEKVIDKPIPEMQREIREYQAEIKRLGPLNMKAISEYEKMKKEYESLKEKVEKILQEKYSILKVIEEVERKRKEAFFKVFNQVNEKFRELYYKFCEGEARLELEEEGNIYSGLIIKAKPKGKKMLSIDYLSGGEKVLVALSLLFAIQLFKPCPIYIMDEIDAALDKINSKKVAEAVKEFSKKSQFILITHNETTVKYADIIYGCVMEDGVSKIIGLKINQRP